MVTSLAVVPIALLSNYRRCTENKSSMLFYTNNYSDIFWYELPFFIFYFLPKDKKTKGSSGEHRPICLNCLRINLLLASGQWFIECEEI